MSFTNFEFYGKLNKLWVDICSLYQWLKSIGLVFQKKKFTQKLRSFLVWQSEFGVRLGS